MANLSTSNCCKIKAGEEYDYYNHTPHLPLFCSLFRNLTTAWAASAQDTASEAAHILLDRDRSVPAADIGQRSLDILLAPEQAAGIPDHMTDRAAPSADNRAAD